MQFFAPIDTLPVVHPFCKNFQFSERKGGGLPDVKCHVIFPCFNSQQRPLSGFGTIYYDARLDVFASKVATIPTARTQNFPALTL